MPIKFVLKGWRIANMTYMVQILAWRRTLSEPLAYINEAQIHHSAVANQNVTVTVVQMFKRT